jgi:hypothetical protein
VNAGDKQMRNKWKPKAGKVVNSLLVKAPEPELESPDEPAPSALPPDMQAVFNGPQRAVSHAPTVIAPASAARTPSTRAPSAGSCTPAPDLWSGKSVSDELDDEIPF